MTEPRQVYNPRRMRWETEGGEEATPGTITHADPIMPFGQHRGRRLSEIPDWYLRWLIQERVVTPGSAIEQAVKAEITRDRG